MRLVGRRRSGDAFDLPTGLYEVSAILEDGLKHSALVQVGDDMPTEVVLGPNVENEQPNIAVEVEETEQNEGTLETEVVSIRDTAMRRLARRTDRIECDLLYAVDAESWQISRDSWLFACLPDFHAVPTAHFMIERSPQIVSLPVSPPADPYDMVIPHLCIVRIEANPGGRPRAQAWISPERPEANTLQHMLSTGRFREAADFADEAVELLQYKYRDPTGAALGALILYKTGRLQRWSHWVENLARDFEWLPDGAALLACLLYESRNDRERALDLAIRASERRFLFTEIYSLLLDLLRRWPDDTRADERLAAVERLAEPAPFVDWDATCLSHSVAEDDR